MNEKLSPELRSFLEEEYKSTCKSLDHESRILKDVEDGIVELDPPSGVYSLKSMIKSLTKTKELLERELGKESAQSDD